MYSCGDSNDLLHAFLTLTCPSAYYMLYRNMSIYCNILGAIYRYGKVQYRHSSSMYVLGYRILSRYAAGFGLADYVTCHSQTSILDP